jgi:hypothetical protein
MARRTLALLLFVGLATTAFAQKPTAPAPTLTGKWTMTLEMEVGTATTALVLTQEKEKLTGTYTGRYGTYPLAGKLDARRVEFVVTINAEGTETLMSFWGELSEDGETLGCEAALGGMGNATWFAKRDKK